jgi:hypothetical protein
MIMILRRHPHKNTVGCTLLFSPRRIVCTYFLYGCARRYSTPRNLCTSFLCGCARRYSIRLIACTCAFRGCARRCSTRRIPCTCIFRGCAGTLHTPSSQRLLLLPPSRPLPPHAAPSLPCRLPRTKHWHAFSSPQPPLSPPLIPSCLRLVVFLSIVFELLVSSLFVTPLAAVATDCELRRPASVSCSSSKSDEVWEAMPQLHRLALHSRRRHRCQAHRAHCTCRPLLAPISSHLYG